MARFPVDAPIAKVLWALENLGFEIVRQHEDGSLTPLTVPNHRSIKSTALRLICTQSGISRDEFLAAYD